MLYSAIKRREDELDYLMGHREKYLEFLELKKEAKNNLDIRNSRKFITLESRFQDIYLYDIDKEIEELKNEIEKIKEKKVCVNVQGNLSNVDVFLGLEGNAQKDSRSSREIVELFIEKLREEYIEFTGTIYYQDSRIIIDGMLSHTDVYTPFMMEDLSDFVLNNKMVYDGKVFVSEVNTKTGERKILPMYK